MEFASTEMADEAIKLDGKELLGRWAGLVTRQNKPYYHSNALTPPPPPPPPTLSHSIDACAHSQTHSHRLGLGRGGGQGHLKVLAHQHATEGGGRRSGGGEWWRGLEGVL